MIAVRPAAPADIPEMHRIRLAVRENPLSGETGITESSYAPYLKPDCAWVAVVDGVVAGFAILESQTGSIWALFVDPPREGRGVGRVLLERIVESARSLGLDRLVLNTGSGTRAERFYRRRGCREIGTGESGELRFELRLRRQEQPRPGS